jgi:hypothetical protein
VKLKCKSCTANFEAPGKPKSCPNCFSKNKGFDLVSEGPTTSAPAYESEWDAAASQALTNADIKRPYTLATLANRKGLPNLDCLTALYKAIELPGKANRNRIAFNAFGANYDSREQKLQITKRAVNNKSYPQTGKGAGVCAERDMWADVGPQVKKAAYIGIGQTVCPCKTCMERYSALASTYNAHIMVCWAGPYDSQPANSWLIFPRIKPGTAYGEAF